MTALIDVAVVAAFLTLVIGVVIPLFDRRKVRR